MKTSISFSLIVCIIVQIFFIGCLNTEIYVIIENRTQDKIKDIIIEFVGGEELIPNVKPGEIIKKSIHPMGESSLTVTYTDKKGTYKEKIDVYFEQGYKGSIRIAIGNNGKLSIDNRISL